MIKVDSDVPIPPRPGGRAVIYPWSTTAVGQSFFAPGKTTRKMSNSACYQRERYGRKYTTRAVTEGGVKGVRVWRIE